MKRTPVKRKRAMPRRGRVIDLPYLEWCATQPCCITNSHSDYWRKVESHHVRSFGTQKDDTRIIRLMPDLHRGGKHAIHSISKAEFEQYWGISIEDEIRKLRERYEQEIKSGDQKSAENGLFDGEPPKTLWR